MNELVLMLYYIVFYEMTHRPSILEFYIIDILFLSFSHSSIYPYLSSVILLLKKLKLNDFSCYKDMTDLTYLDWFFRSREYEVMNWFSYYQAGLL